MIYHRLKRVLLWTLLVLMLLSAGAAETLSVKMGLPLRAFAYYPEPAKIVRRFGAVMPVFVPGDGKEVYYQSDSGGYWPTSMATVLVQTFQMNNMRNPIVSGPVYGRTYYSCNLTLHHLHWTPLGAELHRLWASRTGWAAWDRAEQERQRRRAEEIQHRLKAQAKQL